MQDDEALETSIIEMADTRPTMIWLPWLGELPITAAALLMTAAGLLMAIGGTWLWLLSIPPIWWGGARLIAIDYHAFTRIDCWLSTSAWSLDAAAEGGASASPNPIKPPLLAQLGLRRSRPRGIA